MATLSSRCVREAHVLALRSSKATPWTCSFHTVASLRDDSVQQSSGNGRSPTRNSLTSQKTLNTNSAAPSANSDAPPRPSLIRFTGDDGAPATRIPRTADTRNLGLPNTGRGGSRIAVRRPPPAPGASPQGTRPSLGHASDITGSRPPRGSGAPRGGRGGRSSGPPSRRAPAAGRGMKGKSREERGPKIELKDDDKSVAYTWGDMLVGRPLPADQTFSEGELEYFVNMAEEQKLGPSFEPDVGDLALQGSGSTTVTSTRDSAELMHRLMSRSALPSQSTNYDWPSMKAHQLLHGQTVYFHNKDEARAVQDQIKAMRLKDLTEDIESRKPNEQLPKNSSFNLSSFEDIELKVIPETDRSKVQGAWLAGKYVPPGDRAGKNASEIVKSVWRQTARNGTYLEKDEQVFAKKVAGLVPTRAAPAKAPAGNARSKPAAKQTAAA